MASSATAPRCYRLRGRHEDVEIRRVLSAGVNRIGSAEDNTLVLPVAGVSRHHARIEVAPGALVLEDLGSRNGTTVQGKRIARRTLAPGHEIGFGPVALTLEEVDAGDTRLGLVLDEDPATPPVSGRGEESTGNLSLTRTPTLSAVEIPSPLERLLDQVLLRDQGLGRGSGLTCGLDDLVREFGARGATLVEWDEARGAVILAASGLMEDWTADPVFHDLRTKLEEQPEPGCRSAAAGAPRRGVYALMRWPGRPLLGLVVHTDSPSPELVAGLRVVLRLFFVLELRDEQNLPQGSGPRSDLTFPETAAVCRSPAMQRLYGELRPVVRTDLAVLIEGETGVGKEHVARLVHLSSPRRDRPFVAVNCAAIPAELLEAEMFGIGEGVATGVKKRQGCFQEAGGGTLFLDEVGDMSPKLQAKLLRALQEKVVRPVGRPALPVDVRVVSATNTDLLERVGKEEFRRDLYYRLAGYVVRVPPLRERCEDIPVLVEHLLRRAAAAGGREARPIRGLTLRALELLRDYPWPGNVRELDNELRRLAAVRGGSVVESTMLSERIRNPGPMPEAANFRNVDLRLDVHVERVERQVILAALERCGGSQRQAAQVLGLSRNGLAGKLRRLGISA